MIGVFYPHSPHSPNLAPSNYHLFGLLRRHLFEKRSQTVDGFVAEMQRLFESLDTTSLGESIYALVEK